MSMGAVKKVLSEARQNVKKDIGTFDASTTYLRDTGPGRCIETAQGLGEQIMLLAGIVKERGNVLGPVITGAHANYALVGAAGEGSNDPNIPAALDHLHAMATGAERFGDTTGVMHDKLRAAGAHLADCLQALREFAEAWDQAGGHASGSELSGVGAVGALDTYLETH